MDQRGRSCRDQSVVEISAQPTLSSYSYSLPPPEGRGKSVVAAALRAPDSPLSSVPFVSPPPLMTNNRVAVLAVSVVRDVAVAPRALAPWFGIIPFTFTCCFLVVIYWPCVRRRALNHLRSGS